MGRSTHTLFHIHDDDQVIDIEASSYSEARRKFSRERGYFPDKDATVEVEEI